MTLILTGVAVTLIIGLLLHFVPKAMYRVLNEPPTLVAAKRRRT